MNLIQITHTSAEGTLLDGTTRDDDQVRQILKGAGWRWAPSIDRWIIQRSRDHAPKLWLIEATATKLREAGYDIELTIDSTPRAAADVETDRHNRTLQLADRKDTGAEHARANAAAAEARAKAIADGIPFGQPILIGHHSEARARRDAERVHRAHRIRFEEDSRADTLERQAAELRLGEAHRENPQAIARRIAAYEIQERKLQRLVDGYTDHLSETVPPASGTHAAQVSSELEHVRERLGYLRGIRATQLELGIALELRPGIVSAGDLVKYSRDWYEVVRVNPKSVSIRSRVGGSWVDTIPYHQLTGHRPREK